MQSLSWIHSQHDYLHSTNSKGEKKIKQYCSVDHYKNIKILSVLEFPEHLRIFITIVFGTVISNKVKRNAISVG